MADKKFLDLGAEAFVEALSQEGARIVRECEQERTYKHRTKNLKDSYGWGVYHNGKLAAMGFLTNSRQASEPRKLADGEEVWGRDEITAWLRNNKPSATVEYELVVCAAIWYAEELERHRYRVIGMAFSKLKKSLGGLASLIDTKSPLNSTKS